MCSQCSHLSQLRRQRSAWRVWCREGETRLWARMSHLAQFWWRWTGGRIAVPLHGHPSATRHNRHLKRGARSTHTLLPWLDCQVSACQWVNDLRVKPSRHSSTLSSTLPSLSLFSKGFKASPCFRWLFDRPEGWLNGKSPGNHIFVCTRFNLPLPASPCHPHPHLSAL